MNQPMCCLCGQPCEPWPGAASADGYGHNPDPFGDEGDRCCNECNQTKVIPARLSRIMNRKK